MIGNSPASSPTLQAVKALAPELIARADEAEEARSLSGEMVDKLRQAGIFRMVVPKKYGGDALTQAQAVAVIEELAAADAAAAWTAMIAFGGNTMMARFPRATTGKIYADGPDVHMRGAIAPQGRAVVGDDGYRVTGRWPFASGPYPAKWVFAGCVVIENGQPRMGERGPETLIALVPARQAEFIDTWRSVGLRGSDSRDFELKDVFVAKDHTINLFDFNLPNQYDEPMFNMPFPVLTGPTHSAVCLGAVRGGLEDLATLASTKRSAFNPSQTLGESPVFQHRLAELAIRHAALEALTNRQVQDVARMVENGESASPLILAEGASRVGYVHQECTDILNQAFEISGSTPVYTRSALQKRWRDVRVAAQHFGGSTAQYPVYGALLCGEAAAARGRTH